MTVHFIGAGPGAADLLTVRAVRLLQSARMCLFAGTYLDDAVLDFLPSNAERIDTKRLTLDEITAHLQRGDQQGWSVARLCSGDPSLYSAVAEQAQRLDQLGIPWDITPGVPAYAAAAAIVGKELTVPEVAQSVVLTRVQKDSSQMPAGEDLAHFAASGATLVLHLAIRHIQQIVQVTSEFYGVECPVVVAASVSQPQQVILRGQLSDIAEKVLQSGLRQAAIIMIGPALAVTDHAESYLYSQRCRSRQ